jgi:hypothetical protein
MPEYVAFLKSELDTFAHHLVTYDHKTLTIGNLLRTVRGSIIEYPPQENPFEEHDRRRSEMMEFAEKENESPPPDDFDDPLVDYVPGFNEVDMLDTLEPPPPKRHNDIVRQLIPRAAKPIESPPPNAAGGFTPHPVVKGPIAQTISVDEWKEILSDLDLGNESPPPNAPDAPAGVAEYIEVFGGEPPPYTTSDGTGGDLKCENCHGKGITFVSPPGTSETCWVCDGTGTVKEKRDKNAM